MFRYNICICHCRAHWFALCPKLSAGSRSPKRKGNSLEGESGKLPVQVLKWPSVVLSTSSPIGLCQCVFWVHTLPFKSLDTPSHSTFFIHFNLFYIVDLYWRHQNHKRTHMEWSTKQKRVQNMILYFSGYCRMLW